VCRDDKPLCLKYTILHDLSLNQGSSVFEVVIDEWVIRFRIGLHGLLRGQWYELASRLNIVSLNEKDVAVWKWTK
jgi:hypothetical protein